MKDWLKEHKYIWGILFLVLFLSGYYFFFATPVPKNPVIENSFENNDESEEHPKMNQSSSVEKQVPKEIMVDLKGAINKPGVYHANEGERVIDLIERAGGLSQQADETKVNLAMYVEDEMVLYIPSIGEEGASTPDLSGGGAKEEKININKATEAELETLPGIGPSKSAAIIEYRETTGPFKKIEDLQSISGIGEKTFEKLKDKIAVD